MSLFPKKVEYPFNSFDHTMTVIDNKYLIFCVPQKKVMPL